MDKLIEKLKELGMTEEQAIVEVKTMVSGLVEAETEKGKGFYREKDKETKGLRESLKKLGYDSAKHGSVDEYLSAREKDASQKDTTLESLRESVEAMKGELQSERDLRISEHKTAVTKTAQAELMKHLAPKIFGGESVLKGILATSDLELDGDTVKIGGVTVEDYSNDYIKNNPDDVRANQESGRGINPLDNGGSDGENDNLKAYFGL